MIVDAKSVPRDVVELRGKVEREVEIFSAETPWCTIRDNGSHLVIITRNFNVVVSENNIRVDLLVRRPDHDHNDLSSIILKVPNKGIIYGQSRATLRLASYPCTHVDVLAGPYFPDEEPIRLVPEDGSRWC